MPVAVRIEKELRPHCRSFWSPDDVVITLAGAGAWPSLLAAGCCRYPVAAAGASEADAIQRERAGGLANRSSSSSSSNGSSSTGARYLYVTVRPLRRPFALGPGCARELTLCVRSGWDDRTCALHALRRTFTVLHELLEKPHLRVRLKEHFRDIDATGREQHRFAMAQWCQDPHDGALSVCDVEHAFYTPHAHLAPPTSVHWRRDVCCVTQKTVKKNDGTHPTLRAVDAVPANTRCDVP